MEIACDLSLSLAANVAAEFHIPRYTSDLWELLSSDIDAVLLCHTDPKTEAAIAAFNAGKHVLVEKTVCFSLAEIEQITVAQQRAGTVGSRPIGRLRSGV